jgi:hypothetical protein
MESELGGEMAGLPRGAEGDDDNGCLEGVEGKCCRSVRKRRKGRRKRGIRTTREETD